PPRHPVRDGRPEECNAAPHNKVLVETGTGDVDVERRGGCDLTEPVGEGKVTVQPRCEAVHIVYEQVCLECMARPGRGDGAEGGMGAVFALYTLRAPEQEREFVNGERLFCIRPDAVPALD